MAARYEESSEEDVANIPLPSCSQAIPFPCVPIINQLQPRDIPSRSTGLKEYCEFLGAPAGKYPKLEDFEEKLEDFEEKAQTKEQKEKEEEASRQEQIKKNRRREDPEECLYDIIKEWKKLGLIRMEGIAKMMVEIKEEEEEIRKTSEDYETTKGKNKKKKKQEKQRENKDQTMVKAELEKIQKFMELHADGLNKIVQNIDMEQDRKRGQLINKIKLYQEALIRSNIDRDGRLERMKNTIIRNVITGCNSKAEEGGKFDGFTTEERRHIFDGHQEWRMIPLATKEEIFINVIKIAIAKPRFPQVYTMEGKSATKIFGAIRANRAEIAIYAYGGPSTRSTPQRNHEEVIRMTEEALEKRENVYEAEEAVLVINLTSSMHKNANKFYTTMKSVNRALNMTQHENVDILIVGPLCRYISLIPIYLDCIEA